MSQIVARATLEALCNALAATGRYWDLWGHADDERQIEIASHAVRALVKTR
jgi:hypothetical protein